MPASNIDLILVNKAKEAATKNKTEKVNSILRFLNSGKEVAMPAILNMIIINKITNIYYPPLVTPNNMYVTF